MWNWIAVLITVDQTIHFQAFEQLLFQLLAVAFALLLHLYRIQSCSIRASLANRQSWPIMICMTATKNPNRLHGAVAVPFRGGSSSRNGPTEVAKQLHKTISLDTESRKKKP
jgi:hypothetical protein